MTNDESAEAPKPPTTPKPRRWRRRLLIAGAVCIVLLLLAPLALSLGPVRGMVANKLSEKLGRQVHIDSAFAYWFHGVDLEGITISSPAGYEGPLATVKAVHADVGVFGLLTGGLQADIHIDSPHVTIRRGPGEGSNLDGLAESLAGEEPEDTGNRGRSDMSLALTITHGVLEAEAAPGAPPTRIEGIELAFGVGSDGAVAIDLEALAVAAKAGGGDGTLTLAAALDANESGTWKISTSRLDLRHFAALAESMGAVHALVGELELEGAGTIRGGTDVSGTAKLTAASLGGRLADGATLALGDLTATLSGERLEGDSSFQVDVTAHAVAYALPAEDGLKRFAEPIVTAKARGVYQPASQRIVLNEAKLAAGQTFSAEATKPWMVAFGERMTAQGLAEVRVDFGRLGSLRALNAKLGRLTQGRLVASVSARQGAGLDVSMGARIDALSIASPIEGGLPYSERSVTLQARYGQQGAARRIDLYTLQSALLRSVGTSAARPLTLHLKPGHVVVQGPIGLHVDLPALSRLAPDALGLEQREQISGTLEVTGAAKGDEAKSTLDMRVLGRGVRLPARLDKGQTPANLDATLRADMTPDTLRIGLTRIQGSGIQSGTGALRLQSGDDGYRLGDSSVDLVADLAGLRPWIAAQLALARDARLGGLLTVGLKTVTVDDRLVLRGQSHIENLLWQPTAADLPVHEARLSVDHDLSLAPDGERSALTRLVLSLTGLTIDLSGSSFTQSADGTDVDLQGTVRGNAARLAPTVAALLGPDYQDLRATGAIEGRVAATGLVGDGGRDLLMDATLAAGSWTSAGLSIDGTQVTARRAALEDPLAASIRATLNRGPTTISATLVPGTGPRAWTLALDAQGVDTSSLLVDRGPARLLSYALPATLPSDAKVPVLSGLLSAHMNLASSDTQEPAMLDALVGTGKIEMQQGEIKNSTLFQGQGGGALDKVFKLLAVTVPGVGQVTKSLSRALTFQTLESVFSIGDRRVDIEQTKLAGRYVTILTKGTVSFEKRVDLATNLTFEGSVGKDVGKVLPGATVPLRVTGVLPDTQVKPNLDLKKLAGSGLLDQAKGLLKGKKPKDLIKGLKGLLGK